MTIGTVLFNPFTGKPRDPRDIASDPHGGLIWDGEQPLRAALAAQPAEPVEPVAEVASKHGDPERFGEREIRVLADLSKIPYGTKLYAAPPAPAAVPPGMALVPIDPTPEIIATGAVALMKASDSDLDATKEEIAATYRAMIAAAGDKQ